MTQWLSERAAARSADRDTHRERLRSAGRRPGARLSAGVAVVVLAVGLAGCSDSSSKEGEAGSPTSAGSANSEAGAATGSIPESTAPTTVPAPVDTPESLAPPVTTAPGAPLTSPNVLTPANPSITVPAGTNVVMNFAGTQPVAMSSENDSVFAVVNPGGDPGNGVIADAVGEARAPGTTRVISDMPGGAPDVTYTITVR